MDYTTTPKTSVLGLDIASDLPVTDGLGVLVSREGTGHGFPTLEHQQAYQAAFNPTTGHHAHQGNTTNASTPFASGTNQVLTTAFGPFAGHLAYQTNITTSTSSTSSINQTSTVTNVVAPAATLTTPVPIPHTCNICPGVFKRAGDLRRHYKKHFASQYICDCHVVGCNRASINGFYRKDKLAHHLKKAHGL
ncbi:uncharacterized protein PAC_08495 [Phialocephala subalpina]|uniref:C2H2-type domain-containing protein n=1 Tax=Phialocephala subalpina TaxID=576137 RepID=A0A1L7X0P4_9HELO|nr:uncharacterized protein PAC_08495 [Phialocephala subalpina]